MNKYYYYFFLLVLFFINSGCSRENKSPDNEDKLVIPNNIFPVKDVIATEGSLPDFTWMDEKNKIVNLKSQLGAVTLINFWATWCGPCKKELPDLIEINGEMSERGVKVIGISTDRGTNIIYEVREFLSENKVTYTNILDDGKIAEAFGGIRGIPMTFLIDKNGKIVDKYIGIRSKTFFVDRINHLLN